MLWLSLDQLSEEIPDSNPVAQFKIREQKYQGLYEKVVKGKSKIKSQIRVRYSPWQKWTQTLMLAENKPPAASNVHSRESVWGGCKTFNHTEGNIWWGGSRKKKNLKNSWSQFREGVDKDLSVIYSDASGCRGLTTAESGQLFPVSAHMLAFPDMSDDKNS